MILNFYFISELVFYLLGLIVLLSFFNLSKLGYFSWLDTLSRLHANDFFTNVVYYFWTTFWYIPVFVFLTLYVLTFFTKLNFNKVESFIVLAVLTLLGFEYVDYFFLNLNYTSTCLNSENINLLLTNSINKYHPYLFYTSLTFFFKSYFLFLTYRTLSNHIFYNLALVKILVSSRLVLFNIITVTLFLGAWWANQEGSWGGWWNWDPSEVFGLLIMMFIIIYFHKAYFNSNVANLFYDLRYFSLSVSIVYIFIQLNFNLVSHNFGIKIDQFVNTSQLFLALLSLLIYSVYRLNIYIYQHSQLKFIKTCSATVGGGWPLSFTIALIITLVVLLSFVPLFNEFFWKFWGVNLFNFIFKFTTLVVYVHLLSVSYFHRLNIVYLFAYIAIVLYADNLNLVLVAVFVIRISPALIVHFWLNLFILLNVATVGLAYVSWVPSSNLSVGSLNTLVTDSCLRLFSVHNLNIETIFLQKWNNFATDVVWNFYNLNSSLEVHTFINQLSLFFTNQSLLVGSFTNFFLVQLFDQNLLVIFSLFISILTLINFFLKKPLLIIF